ncbi:MAG TPA: ATP-binding protein [Flavisolibacter sp.]|jgi:signal transduction histidine kinase
MDSQQTRIYTTVIITAIILGFIILFFIISIIRQQRKTLKIQKQSVQSQMNALEKDRARIASDLHDELGPMLSAVKMKINSFELTDEDDKVEIEKTNEHIDGMLQRMRQISFNLMPNTLLRKGLVTALQEFVDYTTKSNTLEISLHVRNSIVLGEEKTINVYRVVQEIIHNTLKHAKATRLVVQLEVKGPMLVLQTADNGVGFDRHKNSADYNGIGLKNLVSRTDMMQGKMFLETARGKGTAYTFEIPI